MSNGPWLPSTLDVSRPSPARVYDYLLGGKDNFAVDRQAAARVLEVSPESADTARANRAFLVRGARHMAEDLGIDQFIDLGAGLPTVQNTHEVVQAVTPRAQVVYVDNDPMTLTHARALLEENSRTGYVHADIRDVDAVLDDEVTRDLIDFARPVGLLAVAVLHFVPDSDDPARLLSRYADALAGGGHVALTHATRTGMDPVLLQRIDDTYRDAPSPLRLRSADEIRALLGGLEALEPGVVPVQDWPHAGTDGPLALPMLGALARTGSPIRGGT